MVQLLVLKLFDWLLMGLLVFGFDVGGGSVVNLFFVSIFYIKKKQTVDDVVHY